MKNATYLSSEMDFDGNGKILFYTEKEGNNTFYNYAHNFSFNGREYSARLVVREDSNGHRFYDSEFSDI